MDTVAGLNISSISVPYDESIGDFVARNDPDPYTENVDAPMLVKGYRTSRQTPVTSTPTSRRSPPSTGIMERRYTTPSLFPDTPT